MKFREAIALLAVTSAALTLVACDGNGDAQSAAVQSQTAVVTDNSTTASTNNRGVVQVSTDEANYAPAASLEFQLARDFSSIAAISRNSANVVVGSVVRREDEPYQNVPFSIATIQIEQVIHGGLETGAQISVVETGGVFAGRSKTEPGATGRPVEAGLEGIPVMKPGERWLLFLDAPARIGPVQSGAYGIVGAFQGKLLIGSDDRIAFTGNHDALSHQLFAIAAEARGHTPQWVIGEVRQALVN